jgi:hypothetical protein
MSWPTEANISCNNLSSVVTYEHANSMLSSTRLQLIHGGEKPGSLVGAVRIPSGKHHLRI